MQLDIYRRPEPEHKLSYLAVPAGRPLPQEVTDVDWVSEARGVHMDVDTHHLARYPIDDAGAQIAEKGYAITGLKQQVPNGD